MTEILLQHAEPVKRRVMFALELIDPGRGVPAGKEMDVRAEGFAAPSMTRAGQFVWNDVDPPADRQLKVTATAVRGWFQPYTATINVPARKKDVPVLVKTVPLQPTGLYEPPAGLLSIAGMLVDDANARQAIEGAAVVLELMAKDDNSVLQSQLEAKTDRRGGFVAMASDLGTQTPRPAPPPMAASGVVGWLAVTSGGTTRYSTILPLRLGRLLRLPDPLVWKNLANARPQPPP